MSSSSAVPYEVVRSEVTRDQLKVWGKIAKERGRLAEYTAALRIVEYRLQYEPLEWGDPLYDLPNLGLVMYRGIWKFLSVLYCVRDDKKLVLVSTYRLLDNNPIE